MTEAKGRAAVRERSQGRCEVCGRREATTWSHRQRRSAGGTWSPANGLHSCGHGTAGCEGLISAHRDPITGEPADVFALGLQVRAGENPGEVPARLLHPVYGAGWWQPCDSGLLLWVAPWSPPRAAEQLSTHKTDPRVVRRG